MLVKIIDKIWANASAQNILFIQQRILLKLKIKESHNGKFV
jgi:hypothetical protein